MYTVTEAQRSRHRERQRRETAATATANALLVGMVETFDGGGWTVSESAHTLTYLDNGNERVSCRLDRSKRRMTFHGWTPSLPQGMHYSQKEDGGSASVSIDRTPEAVARDIERRLLPTMREAIAKQTATVAEWTEHQESRESLAAFVADALGQPIYSNRYGKRGDDLTISIGSYADTRAWGSATVSYGDGRVTFDLTVTGRDNLAKIAAVITEIIEGGSL